MDDRLIDRSCKDGLLSNVVCCCCFVRHGVQGGERPRSAYDTYISNGSKNRMWADVEIPGSSIVCFSITISGASGGS